jgi:tRNA threonylcarbamoyladenosine biosynthesis protein TsaB
MLTLGIETATERVSVALGDHDGVLALFEVTRGRRHAEILTPAIEFVCRQADVKIDEIASVAIDVGPGLFTGMRVGIASAKVIAQALQVPMIPLSSLDLLAYPMRQTERLVASVIDARKGEVFYAFYRQNNTGIQRVLDPTVGTIDDLISDLLGRGQETLCVGDGTVRYREEIAAGFATDFADTSYSFPSASVLVELAHTRALKEDWVEPHEVQALYLRQPDAEINWTTRNSGAAS